MIGRLSHLRTEMLVNNTVVAATCDPNYTYCTLKHDVSIINLII